MKVATWLTVAVLGPGAIAVFVWFLLDLKRVLGRKGRAPRSAGRGA